MKRRVWIRLLLGAGAVVLITSLASACSPMYVIRAGIAEAKILRARRPIPEVVLDPTTDERTRTKLTFVAEARNYAIEEFGLDVGRSYTSFTQLESDTLQMVLSASPQDQLTPKTWWFPIVGRVPYKGYFNGDDAIKEQRKLEEDGFDTFLRPTAAFSTLGWFADPLLSTLLRLDEVDLVETVLHELSHNHLFVKGQIRFNESFATFVGRAGAIEFFCNRQGGGSDTVKCLRAQARWRDHQRFESFIEGLVEQLEVVYQDSTLAYETKLTERERIFDRHLEIFRDEVQPSFEASTYQGFLVTPLNNATLLTRIRYNHRLQDFQALLEREGDLRRAVQYLKDGVDGVDDPFDLLPGGTAEPSAS
jgi:predicted aminopeptidase